MPAQKTTRRPRFQRSIARRWFAVGVLVLVGLLYYRPLHDYLDARGQRAARVATVQRLERQQAALERHLHAAASPAVLALEARALGYIRPGEQLFIVKNIPQWRRRQNPSRRGHRG
jgi:cell division protein FtsB